MYCHPESKINYFSEYKWKKDIFNKKIVIPTTHNIEVQFKGLRTFLFYPFFHIFIRVFMTKDNLYGHLQRQFDFHSKFISGIKANDTTHLSGVYLESMKSFITYIIQQLLNNLREQRKKTGLRFYCGQGWGFPLGGKTFLWFEFYTFAKGGST